MRQDAAIHNQSDPAMRISTTTIAGLALGLCIGIAATPSAHAASLNLVQNGSFENGLAGWTIGGVDLQNFPPVAITYGAAQQYPIGAFGEAIPANNAPTSSPDAVGNRAAYFVSDLATNQSLSQTIELLTAGTYEIGFSAYAPRNGFANFHDATIKGIVAGVELASYAVSAGPSQTWQTFRQVVNLSAGSYQVQFVFNTNGFPAKDVVIDQVYVIAGDPPIDVPEPASMALMVAGVLGLGLARRRRKAA